MIDEASMEARRARAWRSWQYSLAVAGATTHHRARRPGPGWPRPAGRPVVPGPLPAHRHEPLPGPGPDQRQGAVQLPGRHRGPGALRRDRDGQEDRPEAGHEDDFWTPVDRLDFEGGARLLGRQGAGRGPVPARRHERPGPARRVDRRHPRLHHPGPVPARARPDPGPDDLDPARLRARATRRSRGAGRRGRRPPAEVQAMNAARAAGQGPGLPDGQAARGGAPPPRLPRPGVVERPRRSRTGVRGPVRGSWPARPPPGPASRPATAWSAIHGQRRRRASRPPAPPSPTVRPATTASPCSSAAARGPTPAS